MLPIAPLDLQDSLGSSRKCSCRRNLLKKDRGLLKYEWTGSLSQSTDGALHMSCKSVDEC